MLDFLRRLGAYLVSRLQERSTVAALVGAGCVLLGVTLPPEVAGVVVSGVVALAGVIAAVPGGK